MLLPPNAQPHHRQAQQREGKRKQQAVFKHPVRQIPQVARHAQRAQHREHAPPNGRAQKHQAHVDQRVNELVHLRVAVLHAQARPKHDGAKQVEPKRKVLPVFGQRGAARAQVYPHRHGAGGQAKHQRNVQPKLPVKPVGLHQKAGHVHAHVPKRHGHRHHHERQLVAPQHHHRSGQRGQLQGDPAPVHVAVVVAVAVGAGVGPGAQAFLQRPHRQRHQAHRQRGQNAGRRVQAFLHQVARHQQRAHQVAQRQRQHTPGAKQLPAQRHKQRHGANGQHAAKVIQRVGERKARPAGHRRPGPACSLRGLCRPQRLGHRGLKVHVGHQRGARRHARAAAGHGPFGPQRMRL